MSALLALSTLIGASGAAARGDFARPDAARPDAARADGARADGARDRGAQSGWPGDREGGGLRTAGRPWRDEVPRGDEAGSGGGPRTAGWPRGDESSGNGDRGFGGCLHRCGLAQPSAAGDSASAPPPATPVVPPPVTVPPAPGNPEPGTPGGSIPGPGTPALVPGLATAVLQPGTATRRFGSSTTVVRAGTGMPAPRRTATGAPGGTSASPRAIRASGQGIRSLEPQNSSTGQGGSSAGAHARAPGDRVSPGPARLSVINRIERVVPGAAWLGLIGALLLATLAGGAAVWSGRRARRQASRVAELHQAALTDPLTGLLNRRGFMQAAERELARAQRYGRPFALAYVDVRGLKRVNDSEGHLAGDALLREVAELLSACARADDAVGRLGGDELTMLLVEQDQSGALAVRRRIHEDVARRRELMPVSSRWDLTVGTAAFPSDGETIDQLLRVADQRLYEQRGIELR